jgi:plastocyanin
MRRDVLTGAAAFAVVLATARPGFSSTQTIHKIRIKEFAFDPETVSAKVGDIIRWTNGDLAPHTATAKEFGWDTDKIASGESTELIVTTDLERDYFCAFHPHMKGNIDIG